MVRPTSTTGQIPPDPVETPTTDRFGSPISTPLSGVTQTLQLGVTRPRTGPSYTLRRLLRPRSQVPHPPSWDVVDYPNQITVF